MYCKVIKLWKHYNTFLCRYFILCDLAVLHWDHFFCIHTALLHKAHRLVKPQICLKHFFTLFYSWTSSVFMFFNLSEQYTNLKYSPCSAPLLFSCREHSLHNENHRLTCATLMPVQKLMLPRGCTACSLDSILPVSGVSVVSTSQLLHVDRTVVLKRTTLNVEHKFKYSDSYFAMVMRPTLFSGLLRVLEWQTILTASCCACSRVGRKSPFLIYSLLSTLKKQKTV